jgi:membrane protein
VDGTQTKKISLNKIEKFIYTSKPVVFISNKAKEIILPGFYGVPLYDVLKFFFKQINTVGLEERAAAISFNFIMAIPAATIFLFTLVPYLPIAQQFTEEILKLTRDLTPNQNTYRLVSGFLDDFFNRPRNALLSFGFLLAIYYSSNAMMGVIRTFDKSIYEESRKGFFIQRRRAILLTLIMITLVIGTVLILLGQDAFFKFLMKWLHIKNKELRWWILNLRWLFILLFFFYGIALTYKYAPSVKERWSLNSPGSLLATFLTILTTILFSWWVNNFSSYNKIYGSIGTLLLLMLLIYINSLVLLVGFELNVSITKLKSEAHQRKLNEMSGLEEAKI